MGGYRHMFDLVSSRVLKRAIVAGNLTNVD